MEHGDGSQQRKSDHHRTDFAGRPQLLGPPGESERSGTHLPLAHDGEHRVMLVLGSVWAVLSAALGLCGAARGFPRIEELLISHWIGGFEPLCGVGEVAEEYPSTGSAPCRPLVRRRGLWLDRCRL